jgi:glycerol transport system ATP-binding protein
MDDGRVMQIGTPEELFERPAHTFVGFFIGSPGMNVLPAEVAGGRAVVAGQTIALGHDHGTPAGRVEIGIRPEYVRLAESGGLPATVRRVEDVGRHRILRADVAGRAVNAILAEDAAVPAGAVRLAFEPARINVYADGWRVSGEAA